jgi:hydroxymethylglutaryl-CoA synthase
VIGITSYGAYVPVYRLDRAQTARAWGGPPMMGEKATGYWDEDSVTMATEAAFDCLDGTTPEELDGLFLASTTLPYKEKQMSSLIATVLDLPRTARAADFANSLRCATTAMKSALDAVEAGAARKILVSAADCRLGVPQSMREQLLGDAAAALLIGNSEVAVSIEGFHSINDEITDVWRRDEDTFVEGAEDRWALTYGFMKNMHEAIAELLNKLKLAPRDFSRVVLAAPDARSHQDLVRNLGFDPKTQALDFLFNTVGSVGSAQAFLMLVAALEEAKPGDRILLANYGNGSDAFSLLVTDQILKIRDRRGIKVHLKSKKAVSYERYIRWRSFLPLESAHSQSPFSSPVVLWREARGLFTLRGSKCRRCSLIDYPIQRVCHQCGSKDEYDEIKLSKKGNLFTYTEDYLSGRGAEQFVVFPVVDLEGGGRIKGHMTECEPDEARIDLPVELAFRKMHDGGGYNNYFWKTRPQRE